jgi:hypothetical protein
MSMDPTRKPEGSDEAAEEQMPPVPDEDGPHDVPDEKVIEKTLPTGPVGDGERRKKEP